MTSGAVHPDQAMSSMFATGMLSGTHHVRQIRIAITTKRSTDTGKKEKRHHHIPAIEAIQEGPQADGATTRT